MDSTSHDSYSPQLSFRNTVISGSQDSVDMATNIASLYYILCLLMIKIYAIYKDINCKIHYILKVTLNSVLKSCKEVEILTEFVNHVADNFTTWDIKLTVWAQRMKMDTLLILAILSHHPTTTYRPFHIHTFQHRTDSLSDYSWLAFHIITIRMMNCLSTQTLL
jgi:hypothetical protein